MASAISFVALGSLYFFYQNHNANLKLPNAFIYSTISITAATHFVLNTRNNLEDSAISTLQRNLLISLFMLFVFCTFQWIGWHSLANQNAGFTSAPSNSIVYLLSGLHLLHVFAMIIYNLHLYVNCKKETRTEVKILVYITEPYIKIKFQMFRFFWVFLEIVWLLILGIMALKLL
ncbi:MAG: hypothetical protein KDC92_07245 [Bacteroidetes bacterium]|nr:hypothetical protein [Bacteroidota bacterium]